MADMPSLDRMESIRFDGGRITITVSETHYDQCSDSECTKPHRLLESSVPWTVDATPENLAKLGEHFLAMALGYYTPVPDPTDGRGDLADEYAERVRWIFGQNIVGASKYEQNIIRAVSPAVLRTVDRLAATIDTAMTGDRIE